MTSIPAGDFPEQERSTRHRATPAKPVRAVSVAIVRSHRFLLVRRAREPAKGLYAFPGGRVEAGETLEEAARREVLEETGLDVTRLEHHCDLDLQPYSLTVFRGRADAGEARASDDAEAVGWFDLGQMAGLPITRSTLLIAREIALDRAARNALHRPQS